MKLSTNIARELFLYGPAGGKRITSVKELVRQSGSSERAIHEHMPEWREESERLAAGCKESGYELSLSAEALNAHKSDCEFLRQEVDRLKKHLRGLTPADDGYSGTSQPPFPRPPIRPDGCFRGLPQKQIPSSARLVH